MNYSEKNKIYFDIYVYTKLLDMKRLITIRIDENKYIQYKKILDENGMDMSKRIRNFIDSEIEKYKADEKV